MAQHYNQAQRSASPYQQAPSPQQQQTKTARDRESDAGAKPSSSTNARKVAPPGISPLVASSTIQRLLAIRVREEGFERAETPAMVRLELEVVAFIEQVFARAKAFADNSARSRPTASDVLAAAQEYDLDLDGLRQESKENLKRARKRKHAGEPEQSLNLELVPPVRKSTHPELLASDDEDSPSVVPQTLRALPPHLPPLPPKHTYLRTPVPPAKKQALPSLEKKLENAALVQESLRSLLLATEVDADANDGELFGGVVNWEATKYPRKKWKIGS